MGVAPALLVVGLGAYCDGRVEVTDRKVIAQHLRDGTRVEPAADGCVLVDAAELLRVLNHGRDARNLAARRGQLLRQIAGGAMEVDGDG